jgi:hypothetical protein
MTGSRAPFIVVAVIALLPLLVLGAAAPGGGDWRWLEYPRYITMIAFSLGIGLCFARHPPTALLVLAGTVAITLGWELIGEHRGLSKLGRTDMFRSELGLLVDLSVGRVAPWLVGFAYGALAYLSISRSRDPHKNRKRAAIWLLAIAAIALALTLRNESWLTLENLKGDGVYRSSVAWPDTKKLSLVADLLALIAGCIALFVNPLPRARPPA